MDATQRVEGTDRTIQSVAGGSWTTWDHEEIVRLVLTPSDFRTIGKHPTAGRLLLLLKGEGLAENKSHLSDAKDGRLFPLGDLAMFIAARTVDDILAIIDPVAAPRSGTESG